MKNPNSPRIALALLHWLSERNEPLAGDLLEEFRRRQSRLWLWSQILVALAMGSFRQHRVPVALNLTPIDPAVAEWKMDRALGPKKINMSAPGQGIGGLGMMVLGLLLSSVVPDVWWFVIGGIVSGVALGITKTYVRRNHALPDARDGLLVRHYFM